MKTILIAVAAGLLLLGSLQVAAKGNQQANKRVETIAATATGCVVLAITVVDADTGEEATDYVTDCSATAE